MTPFSPATAGTKSISATSTTANVALPTTVWSQVEITNLGTGVVYVEFGDSTVAAVAATGYPVAAGQSKIVSRSSDNTTHAAAICDTGGTATVKFSVGIGT